MGNITSDDCSARLFNSQGIGCHLTKAPYGAKTAALSHSCIPRTQRLSKHDKIVSKVAS